VRDRQIWIQVERATERLLGAIETLALPGLDVLGHHMMDAAEPRPRGREGGIFFHRAQVQIARDDILLGIVAELVAAQEKFVRLRTGRHVAFQLSLIAFGERQR
jgi:hypothetical protein